MHRASIVQLLVCRWACGLLATCVLGLLSGCVFIPDYRHDSNGAPRPEALVGDGRPIQVGKTSLVDALIVFNDYQQHAGDRRELAGYYSDVRENWPVYSLVSDNRRSIALPYNLISGTMYYAFSPFGMIEDQYESRWLIFDFDDRKLVTRFTRDFENGTFDAGLRLSSEFKSIFDEAELKRLSDAGIDLSKSSGSARDAEAARLREELLHREEQTH